MREGKEVKIERSPELEDAIAAIGFENAPIDHAFNHFTYVFPIITWRKANAIHKFFVDTCQDGNDNCQRHYVSRESLEELLETINTILAVKTPVARELKAEELLPTDIEGCSLAQKNMTTGTLKILKIQKRLLKKFLSTKKTQNQENALIVSIINHLGRTYDY